MKLKNLNIDTEIQFGKMIWIIRKKDKDANTVTLALKDSIRNKELDAAEPESSDEMIANYGNNNYALSNIRQWLNSNKKDWFRKTHEYDAPPNYANKEGFMSRFGEKALKRIAPKRVPGNDSISDFFYLPSEEEACLVTGEQFDRNWVWTSTPYSGNSCGARYVLSAGALGSFHACSGYVGVRPLCDLQSGTKVEKVNGIWTVARKKQTERKNKIPELLKLLNVKADEPFQLKVSDTISQLTLCDNNSKPYTYTICENGQMFQQTENDSCVADCDLIVPILRGDYTIVKLFESNKSPEVKK